jgi:hypothetical protein
MNVTTKTTLKEMLAAAKHAQNKLHNEQFKIHFLELIEVLKKTQLAQLLTFIFGCNMTNM